MKKLTTVLCMGIFIASCGTTKTGQEETVMTQEQETALADSLSTQMENARIELEQETQENLSEIDSLLENF